MDVGQHTPALAIVPAAPSRGEERMLHDDRWTEIHRLHDAEGRSVSAIARLLELDRKTVRRCLRQPTWTPYQRAARSDTLLAAHQAYVTERAAAVHFSARILMQELKGRGFTGSYETVKRALRPLRTTAALDRVTQRRFETPPGQQSQIDWGQIRTWFRATPVTFHIFVLTLGFSRRSFYELCLHETLPQFLEAHERAFDHFGGHTLEHLYDRPRTVCRPGDEGRPVWNSTFKAFADFWSFEPRVCAPYRAQTKGKVESGVKYVKRNFFPGRTFIDDADAREQLGVWMAEVADVRVHGTTHERPCDRFTREQPHLVRTGGHGRFALDGVQVRIVADDWLVSLATNRYSVPFTLIGQTVDVQRTAGEIHIRHRGQTVAVHPEVAGQHQVRILPAHGPGPSARNARTRSSTPPPRTGQAALPEVEVRDLAVYDAVATCAGGAS